MLQIGDHGGISQKWHPTTCWLRSPWLLTIIESTPHYVFHVFLTSRWQVYEWLVPNLVETYQASKAFGQICPRLLDSQLEFHQKSCFGYLRLGFFGGIQSSSRFRSAGAIFTMGHRCSTSPWIVPINPSIFICNPIFNGKIPAINGM